jgi:hypothetical protein
MLEKDEVLYLRDEYGIAPDEPAAPPAATYPLGKPMEYVHASTDPSRCYTLASGSRVHLSLGCRCKNRR